MDKSDRKKLETLLDYWIDHNKEHGEEFKEWAEKAKELGELITQGNLLDAAQYMQKSNEALLAALEELRRGKS